MKKKKILIIGIILITTILVGIFLTLGGSRTDIFLKDFELSQDGKTMTLKVGVSSSAGYIRNMKVKQGGDNKYITFYSTFGINSKLGAKDTFEITLNNSTDEIYFYTGLKGHKKILDKNDINQWINVSNYEAITTLKKNQYASTETLVKFDNVLYGKSYAIIDYAGGSEKIGIIDKLVDEDYIPKLDNETNEDDLLYAEVYNKTEDSIVLFYDNEYVLFGKIK